MHAGTTNPSSYQGVGPPPDNIPRPRIWAANITDSAETLLGKRLGKVLASAQPVCARYSVQQLGKF